MQPLSENIWVYNNTSVGNNISISGRADAMRMVNNILVGPSSMGGKAEKLDHNLHFSEDTAALEK